MGGGCDKTATTHWFTKVQHGTFKEDTTGARSIGRLLRICHIKWTSLVHYITRATLRAALGFLNFTGVLVRHPGSEK